ncbi:MAG: L,D-transpeptidase family protein [Nitrospiraceae bacterium]|nr:L,D-transpeptidase family protein [Nitrospiraceae bacterium]
MFRDINKSPKEKRFASPYVSWFFFAVLLLFPAALVSADDSSLDSLRATVARLETEVSELEQQNRGLRSMITALDTDDTYIVVDTVNNRLSLRRADKVLLTAVVGTGSRNYIEEETGRNWFFESPTGSLTVLGKERNPVWIRPDWSYVEENMPVPPPNDPDRIVREVLGKYALLLGNGYKIHGTKYKELLGTHFTHGCISVGDKDLETLHKIVPIGTKVYIY